MGRKKILRFDDLEVACCPYCGSADFKKDGIRCKKQRYRCKGCGKTFTATTGTFLANTKKSEAAWKKYVLSLTNDLTLKAGAEIGGMSKNSAFLWRKKLYSCLAVYEKSLVLAGTVWFDEIYFSVSKKRMTFYCLPLLFGRGTKKLFSFCYTEYHEESDR